MELGENWIVSLIDEFMNLRPEVAVELVLSDDYVDSARVVHTLGLGGWS